MAKKMENGDPAVIEWKGIKVEAFYSTSRTCHFSSTSRTCHFSGRVGRSSSFTIELKHLSKVTWEVSMGVYGLRTSERRICEDIPEVLSMMDDCMDGLISLLSDGLKLAKELRDAE